MKELQAAPERNKNLSPCIKYLIYSVTKEKERFLSFFHPSIHTVDRQDAKQKKVRKLKARKKLAASLDGMSCTVHTIHTCRNEGTNKALKVDESKKKIRKNEELRMRDDKRRSKIRYGIPK